MLATYPRVARGQPYYCRKNLPESEGERIKGMRNFIFESNLSPPVASVSRLGRGLFFTTLANHTHISLVGQKGRKKASQQKM
jgi:hypothetical protein